MQRIIFNNGAGVSVIIPANCGLTIEQIAKKDVPAGVPYKIVDAADIPADRTFRDAWECDITLENCDGVGGVE